VRGEQSMHLRDRVTAALTIASAAEPRGRSAMDRGAGRLSWTSEVLQV